MLNDRLEGRGGRADMDYGRRDLSAEAGTIILP